MTYGLNLNCFLRNLYPTLVLLLAALAWNASGQAGNLIDFKLPKMTGPSWRAPGRSLGVCADEHGLQPLDVGSCRINSEPARLNDENIEPIEQLDSHFLVQSQSTEDRSIFSNN